MYVHMLLCLTNYPAARRDEVTPLHHFIPTSIFDDRWPLLQIDCECCKGLFACMFLLLCAITSIPRLSLSEFPKSTNDPFFVENCLLTLETKKEGQTACFPLGWHSTCCLKVELGCEN